MNTKQQVVESLKKWIAKNNFSYDKNLGLRCRDKELEKLRDGKKKRYI